MSHVLAISVPKPFPLVYDGSGDGCQMYVALPDQVSYEDLCGFRVGNKDVPFEIMKNPSGWLSRGGHTMAPGVTRKSQVIVIAQHLYDDFKKIFYPWLRDLLTFRKRQKEAAKQSNCT